MSEGKKTTDLVTQQKQTGQSSEESPADVREEASAVTTEVREDAPAVTGAEVCEEASAVTTEVREDAPAVTGAEVCEEASAVTTEVREDAPAVTGAEVREEASAVTTEVREDAPAVTGAEVREEASAVTTEVREDAPAVTGAKPGAEVNDFNKWLEAFYKECGREVTLAYTTLNQMKNWAMVIVAALISAMVTLGRPGEGEIKPAALVGMHAAAVVAYVFNLRFFVRAILCYINLSRWNRLQASIVEARLIPKPVKVGETPATQDSQTKLKEDIELYYHSWRSPINRKSQLIQNLKLGFALVLGLPLFFVIVWSVELWDNWLVRGLAVFAVGSTLVEGTDFFRSSFFDDPERDKRRRKSGKKAPIFPVPVSQGGHLVTWCLNLAISTGVAVWPNLKPRLQSLIEWFGCR